MVKDSGIGKSYNCAVFGIIFLIAGVALLAISMKSRVVFLKRDITFYN